VPVHWEEQASRSDRFGSFAARRGVKSMNEPGAERLVVENAGLRYGQLDVLAEEVAGHHR